LTNRAPDLEKLESGPRQVRWRREMRLTGGRSLLLELREVRWLHDGRGFLFA
jgi:hypothetical protein